MSFADSSGWADDGGRRAGRGADDWLPRGGSFCGELDDGGSVGAGSARSKIRKPADVAIRPRTGDRVWLRDGRVAYCVLDAKPGRVTAERMEDGRRETLFVPASAWRDLAGGAEGASAGTPPPWSSRT